MEEVKKLIEEFIEKNNKITEEKLKKALKIKGETKTKIYNKALKELREEGKIYQDEKERLTPFSKNQELIHGKIKINKAGNGFIKDNQKTIYIENKDLNGALDEDIVIIEKDQNPKVKQILKRNKENIILEVQKENKTKLIPHHKNQNIKVDINKNELKNLSNGDLILVKITTEKTNDKYKGEIIKTIGNKNEKEAELKALALEYGIPVEFSKESLQEAKNIKQSVTKEDLKDRIDLRKKQIVTIDCDDTKDRDDAVYVEKTKDGNYKLYVSIIDISHYIKPNTSLYEEAKKRCTSHYLNNICIPMFPKEISNGICSLNENEDRLTKTCEMKINQKGEVIDYKIYNSVINSKKAMKYSEVNQVLENKNLKEYTSFLEQLKIMEELNKILEQNKHQRAYLDFDIQEIKVNERKDGKIENFTLRSQKTAEKIIENFMILANQTIANHYSWLPFIYRVHESPNEEKIKETIEKIKKSGIKIPNNVNSNPYSIKKALDKIKEKDEHGIYRKELLKSMKKAKYDTTNEGHFALQLDTYTHFTSPIRRLPDFIIQTLISKIDTLDYSKESIENLEKTLNEVAKESSKVEKIAIELEDEALKMAMAEYMENHIGETTNGVITDIYISGALIKTVNQITGKLKLEDMKDDKYYVDKDQNVIIGKKTKEKYHLGDQIEVTVKKADKKERTINFEKVRKRTK